jgi:hypothetical protein
MQNETELDKTAAANAVTGAKPADADNTALAALATHAAAPAPVGSLTLDKQKLHVLLDELINKHNDNTYVAGRLTTYISQLLPSALDTALTVNRLREERKRQLSAYRDDFVRRFLSKNMYFYSPHTELFLKYDDLHFRIYSEDDIQHQILTNITHEQALMPWKYKIKINIMKLLKERSPLKVIPESVTIQFVLNQLYPTFFASRNAAKYFLTVIGDSMGRTLEPTTSASTSMTTTTTTSTTTTSMTSVTTNTNTPLVYIMSPLVRELVRELANQSYVYFGPSAMLHNIKFKYHDHQYSACRLIPSPTAGSCGRINHYKPVPLSGAILKNTLDFLCVAAHYSTRYGSADQFLQQCGDPALVDHALLLHRHSPALLVDLFVNQSITVNCPGAKISVKTMLFLWKKFLLERGLPNVLFYETWKTLLKERLVANYDPVNDSYLNVTSVHIPLVANFLKFWEATMRTAEEDEAVAEEEEDELEIEELAGCFKIWLNETTNLGTTSSTSTSTTTTLNTNGPGVVSRGCSVSALLELLRFFFPDVVVEDDKYLLQVRCTLWNKREEVEVALAKSLLNSADGPAVSLYDAYAAYTAVPVAVARAAGRSGQLLVSKRYFDRVARELYVVDADGQMKWAGESLTGATAK